MKSFFYYFLSFLFISALLWHVVPPAGHFDVDSYGYDSIAAYFAQTGDLTDPHQPESAPIQPVGYPFIVGVFYKIFGRDVRPILIAQILLMCVALFLLMRIAQNFGGKKCACITGLFFLLSPGCYIYPQLLLAETFLVVLLLFMLERYLLFLRTGNMHLLMIIGVCAGISMLIKPVVMLLMVALLGITWCAVRAQKKSMKHAMLCMLVLFGTFALPVLVYVARNYVRYGHAAFAPMMPLNIYQVFLAKVMGALTHKDPQEFIESELRFQGAHSFDYAGWDHARDLFAQHVKAYPFLCIKIWCINVIKTWCGLYVTQLKKMIEPDGSLVGHSFFVQSGTCREKITAYIAGGTSLDWIVALGWYECIWSILRLLLASFGMYLIFKKDTRLGWLFLSVCISLSVPTGIDGCCRYRIIFEAVLILLSAIGFLEMFVRCFNKKKEQKYDVAW